MSKNGIKKFVLGTIIIGLVVWGSSLWVYNKWATSVPAAAALTLTVEGVENLLTARMDDLKAAVDELTKKLAALEERTLTHDQVGGEIAKLKEADAKKAEEAATPNVPAANNSGGAAPEPEAPAATQAAPPILTAEGVTLLEEEEPASEPTKEAPKAPAESAKEAAPKSATPEKPTFTERKAALKARLLGQQPFAESK